MPIYEYECSSCGHRVEVIQKVNDPLLEECPQCNEATLRKMVSAAGFRLKGTGWYVTDFRDKGKPNNKQDAGKKAGSSREASSKDELPKAEPTTSKSDASAGSSASASSAD